MMGFNSNHFHYLVAISLVISNLNINPALAARNVTIDDRDSSITYSPPGAWSDTNPTSLDFGGSHKLTDNPSATASFSFTGTAIYFLSPRWPYTVNTAVSLDSGPVTLIDLVDHSRPDAREGPETVAYSVVWSATGLTNTQHSIRISVGAGQPYAIVDGLIYTDGTDVTSSSSSSQRPSSSLSSTSTSSIASSTVTVTATPTPSAKSKSQNTVAIALGSSLGVLALILIIWALWYFCRRRKRPASEDWATSSTPPVPSMSGYSSVSAIGPNVANRTAPWSPDQLYNNNNINGYHMTQSNDGQALHNPRYENVGIPTPPIPPQPYYHENVGTSTPPMIPSQPQPYYHENVGTSASSIPFQPYYDRGGYQNGVNSRNGMYQSQVTGRVPNPYEPSYGLSTITESSTPQMGDGKASLENRPDSFRGDSEHYTAQPGSETSDNVSRQQHQKPPPYLDHDGNQRVPSPNTFSSKLSKPIESESKEPHGYWI